MPERAAAGLAALALPALPVDESGAVSAPAVSTTPFPPQMSLKFVSLRHLTGQWPASGTPSTPQPARPGGRLTAQNLADILADPTAPTVTEALPLLSVTARQALTEASQRADRQVCEGCVAPRVRALLTSRTAPGGPALWRLLHDRHLTRSRCDAEVNMSWAVPETTGMGQGSAIYSGSRRLYSSPDGLVTSPCRGHCRRANWAASPAGR